MEKVARATLRYLFQNYLKGPTVSYTINCITQHYKADAAEVSTYLLEKNWIRERWTYQDGLVACRITVAGIEEIDQHFVHEKLKHLIGGLAESGGTKSLMDIFQYKIEDYPIALDIVYQLEKLGLISINHLGGNINIQLTSEGWRFFERKGRSMFTLMAVA